MKKFIFCIVLSSLTLFSSENIMISITDKLPPEIVQIIISCTDFTGTLSLSQTNKEFFNLTQKQKYQQYLSSLFQIDLNVSLSEDFGWKEGLYFLWNLSKFNEPLFAIETTPCGDRKINDAIKKYVRTEQIYLAESKNPMDGIKIQTIDRNTLLQDFSHVNYSDYINKITRKKLLVIDWERGVITEENIHFLGLQENALQDFFIYYKNQTFHEHIGEDFSKYLVNSFDTFGTTIAFI